ncbi:MAG: hypothetical protein O7G86_13620 [Gammaproteobacteria bacterium]|nr:hypothetical protein [Gammaproteobacteria bacterium]
MKTDIKTDALASMGETLNAEWFRTPPGGLADRSTQIHVLADHHTTDEIEAG